MAAIQADMTLLKTRATSGNAIAAMRPDHAINIIISTSGDQMSSKEKLKTEFKDRNGNPYPLDRNIEKIVRSLIDDYGCLITSLKPSALRKRYEDRRKRSLEEPEEVYDYFCISGLSLKKDGTTGESSITVEYDADNPKIQRFVDWTRYTGLRFTRNESSEDIDPENLEDISQVMIRLWQRAIYDHIVYDSIHEVLGDFYDIIDDHPSEFKNTAWYSMYMMAKRSMLYGDKDSLLAKIMPIINDAKSKAKTAAEKVDMIAPVMAEYFKIRRGCEYEAFVPYARMIADIAEGKLTKIDDSYLESMAQDIDQFADRSKIKKAFTSLYLMSTYSGRGDLLESFSSIRRKDQLGTLWDKLNSRQMGRKHLNNKELWLFYADSLAKGSDDSQRRSAFVDSIDQIFDEKLMLEGDIDQKIVGNYASEISKRRLKGLCHLVAFCENMNKPSFMKMHNYLWAVYRPDSEQFIKMESKRLNGMISKELVSVGKIWNRLYSIWKKNSEHMLDVSPDFKGSIAIVENFLAKYDPTFNAEHSRKNYETLSAMKSKEGRIKVKGDPWLKPVFSGMGKVLKPIAITALYFIAAAALYFGAPIAYRYLKGEQVSMQSVNIPAFQRYLNKKTKSLYDRNYELMKELNKDKRYSP